MNGPLVKVCPSLALAVLQVLPLCEGDIQRATVLAKKILAIDDMFDEEKRNTLEQEIRKLQRRCDELRGLLADKQLVVCVIQSLRESTEEHSRQEADETIREKLKQGLDAVFSAKGLYARATSDLTKFLDSISKRAKTE